MPKDIPSNSVGLVSPQKASFDTPLDLVSGKTLPGFELVYETYGQLNPQKSNAVLICHALSGDHHAAGFHSMEDKKPGWWDSAIGPGKPIDTDHFFVVCLNNLGGCNGSTGPASINAATGDIWGPEFPFVTVKDWVHSQAMLADLLGVEQWAAVVGGSLGGMQALQWSIQLPHRLRNCIVVGSAPKLSAQNIAFNEVARQAIRTDPNFFDGRYKQQKAVPATGLKLARMLGHLTYLSDDAMKHKFGRQQRTSGYRFDYDVEFEVESYLRYQGEQFVHRFDANTYLLMTKALDYFDPASEHNDNLTEALSPAQCNFLVVSFTSDWRFSPERSKEIVKSLIEARKQVSYAEVEANHGHDAFLMPIPHYMQVFSAHMKQIIKELNHAS
ncbi:homoserine O-succinyltransferase MetX [Pelagibaculum spongiae]|uniref:Homoserine O-succinyltransferase n=1 Tax=Pelagibaculum spongiae TaxID=2080658 RepID=A0A2V1H2I0_9GAMM|nr:homoserine O-acetyltransferase [Pelagibaculum spongiae]PVZ72180.1 homoserine O-acetyltransferase [Pelagibaculum spongiae]